MTAKERITVLIADLGMNAKSFSEMCGYQRPQVIYDILKGRTRDISASLAANILKAVSGLNRVWLLTGTGEMYEHKGTPAATEPQVTAVTVPLVPLSAFAGPIASYYESGVTAERCPRVLSPSADADLAVPISGDSMEPLISDGSYVFIKRINEQAFIPWGQPLVLDTENGVFIKNVMPDDSNESYIWAESINPKYPRMHIPKGSIRGMYRVLNVTKSFITM